MYKIVNLNGSALTVNSKKLSCGGHLYTEQLTRKNELLYLAGLVSIHEVLDYVDTDSLDDKLTKLVKRGHSTPFLSHSQEVHRLK